MLGPQVAACATPVVEFDAALIRRLSQSGPRYTSYTTMNRIQPEAETRAVIAAARKAGFRSVSIDLIYGLPRQTVDSMTVTLDKVVAASPDRISVYNYAQLRGLEQDGLLTVGPEWISVTPRGRLLIRNICMVFDRYLQDKRAEGPRYSRTI
jgi:coproporphyrinogen III oxidase-like Fe-S oxidoreductase